MKLVIVTVVVLLCSELTSAWFGGGGGSDKSSSNSRGGYNSKGRTTVDVGVEATNDGAKANVGISHQGDGWSGGIQGTVDDEGNWGAKAGVSIELGKRSVAAARHLYEVEFQVNKCDFDVYDLNRDELITKDEIHNIFKGSEKADKFFEALDMTSGDGQVDREEFISMRRFVIKGCQVTVVSLTDVEA